MDRTLHFFRFWMPVVLLCAAIFIQSSFPSPALLPRFAFSDKLLHVFAYGVLSALLYRALSASPRWQGRSRWLFWASFWASVLYGASDEWHQSFVVGRYAEIADLIADTVGALFGSALYAWLHALRGQRAGL